MLIIHEDTTASLLKAMEFAVNAGLINNFLAKLNYLSGYANGPGCIYSPVSLPMAPGQRQEQTGRNTRCTLYTDRQLLSFSFVIQSTEDYGQTWKHHTTGGLIYFGSPDVNEAREAALKAGDVGVTIGWSTHT
jgi:hypothetical protein